MGLAHHGRQGLVDRNPAEAPVVIRAMLEKTPTVIRLWADGGYQGPKLASTLQEMGLADLVEIVNKSKESKGFTVIPRRWVVERTFAWMLPTVGQGFRADTREFPSLGTAGSLPVPDASHRARDKRLRHRNMMISDL